MGDAFHPMSYSSYPWWKSVVLGARNFSGKARIPVDVGVLHSLRLAAAQIRQSFKPEPIDIEVFLGTIVLIQASLIRRQG